MSQWRAAIEPSRYAIRLILIDPEHNEALKALLPARPQHPRALLTLLEGLSLWVDQPLTVAIAAAESAPRVFGEALFGDGLVPLDSALVRFDFQAPLRRRRTIAGIGDFRQLRLALRRAP